MKKGIIEKVLSLDIEYPVCVVSYADWRGGCQMDIEAGKRAADILESGAGDFNYIEFTAMNPHELARGLQKDPTFQNVYSTEHGMEYEDVKLSELI